MQTTPRRDVGEAFSGVDNAAGRAAVENARLRIGGDLTMSRSALRWILMFDAVTGVMTQLKALYDADIRPAVHCCW